MCFKKWLCKIEKVVPKTKIGLNFRQSVKNAITIKIRLEIIDVEFNSLTLWNEIPLSSKVAFFYDQYNKINIAPRFFEMATMQGGPVHRCLMSLSQP